MKLVQVVNRGNIISKALLEDANIDAGIVSIVYLIVHMDTFAKGECQTEDMSLDSSIAEMYGTLIHAMEKPWVTVVDSGVLHDLPTRELEKCCLHVFRTAYRALAMLNL